MDIVNIFQQLAVALAIGSLIGIERGWKEREGHEGTRVAGVRTFALIGLLGGVWGVLARQEDSGVLALVLAFATVSIALAAFRFREAIVDEDFGATTVVAAMLTFALGALAVTGEMIVAAACGVVVAGILALKAVLHEWIKRITWQEMRASLVLLAMTIILYPVLPDRIGGLLESLNPQELWLMTILMAALSFVGYLAIRIAGERRGIILSGIAGGLVSSTATTINMARLAKSHPQQARLFAGGAVFAGAVMIFRVLFIAGIFNLRLLLWLLPPLLFAGVTMFGCGYFLMRSCSSSMDASPLKLHNPFQLRFVLEFGTLLAVIMAVVDVTARHLGDMGIFAVSAVSGLADVDAITLSLSKLDPSELATGNAVLAILLAVITNTFAKVGFAWIIGGTAQGARLFLIALVALAAGYLGYQVAQISDPFAVNAASP